MSKIVDIYNLVFKEIAPTNRATKTNIIDNRKAYKKKNENIVKAVKQIVDTKTKSVSYFIGFDEIKQMHYITFDFVPKKWMKKTKISFHLIPYVYNKIKDIEES